MTVKQVIHSAYFDVKQTIWNNIAEGKYKPGDRLPSIAEIAKKHGVSDRTVHQAISELAWEGILKVSQGRGTFVALPKQEYELTKDFTEQADQLGGVPRTEVYNTRWVLPEPEVTEKLGVQQGQKVWEVEKLHYLDEVPVMVESTLFPRKLAEDIMDDMQKLRSTFLFLFGEMGLKELDVEIRSVKVSSERKFADLLHIPYKPYRTTFFQFERLISAKGRPLAFSFHVLRSDKFQLHLFARRNST
jgi:DNA-binding GntR family transcriptional regulator